MEETKEQKTIKLFYKDTIYAALKEGINTHFIIPYALALKAGNDFIAIVSSAPMMVGSFVQLFASDLLNIVRNRKKVIVYTALIDAILWLPILLIPFLWNNNYILLINFLVIQAICNHLLNPFYNSLMGDILPKNERGKILAKINRISGIMSFFSSLFAGFILSLFKHKDPFLGFAIIFFIAFLSRLISAWIKSKFYEPTPQFIEKAESLFHFTLNIRKSNFGQFVMYSSWIKFAVGISAPFFTVYMLQYLNLDFFTYSLINAAAIISSFLVLNKWGRSIDKRGSKWMLGISGFLVPTIPVLWIIFKKPLILFVVELFSGAVWAAFNLSTSNFVMDATNNKNRLVMTSYFNFFIGLATFFGSIIGGQIMTHLPIDFMGNLFYFVFGLSAALRLFFSLYFLRKIKEERIVDFEIKGPKGKRIITILPKEGAIWDFVPRKK